MSLSVDHPFPLLALKLLKTLVAVGGREDASRLASVYSVDLITLVTRTVQDCMENAKG